MQALSLDSSEGTSIATGARHPASSAKALVCAIDALFCGMISAGLSLEMICAYLGMAPETALDHVVRLGLATPKRKALQASRRGWSVQDIRCLIAMRPMGVHPETIGQALDQPRSANAVRAKWRRIGGTPPDRKTIFRPDPDHLARLRAPTGSASTAAIPAAPVVPLPPKPAPTTIEEIDYDDLTWIGRLQGRRGRLMSADAVCTNMVAVHVFGVITCAGLDRRVAAKLLGISVDSFRTTRTRIGVPAVANRAVFTDVLDLEVGEETIRRNGLEIASGIRRDDRPAKFFWRRKSERGVRSAPSERGATGRGEPRTSQPITVVTRAILDAEAHAGLRQAAAPTPPPTRLTFSCPTMQASPARSSKDMPILPPMQLTTPRSQPPMPA